MSGESANKKQTVRHLRRGLSIYKTGRSPYWHARIYDSRTKRYVVRSTKETLRLEAIEVAEELLADFRSKQDTTQAVTKDRSFEHFASIYTKMQTAQAKSKQQLRTLSDHSKLLYREGDGLVSYLGKHDVSAITTGMVRDYLVYLDEERGEPLANSTKNKHSMMVRKVLQIALEDGLIDLVPQMPKNRVQDSPRLTFTGSEYKKLITTARKIADEGTTKVRGVLVTREHVEMWTFMVHAFLRPSETELFGLRHCDVTLKGKPLSEDNPLHLELEISGKTGLRFAATMPRAYSTYLHLLDERVVYEPDDYVFMPEYKNRTTAVNTARRIFNHFLEVTDLKTNKDGNERSPYSLRHYALQVRLRSSKGKVNIYWLAKNAGTSVDQLERFYLKNMALSPEQVRNLQSF